MYKLSKSKHVYIIYILYNHKTRVINVTDASMRHWLLFQWSVSVAMNVNEGGCVTSSLLHHPGVLQCSYVMIESSKLFLE